MPSLGDVALIIGTVVFGSIAGKVLVALRGKRWRDSVRGLLFATTLIEIALWLLVANWKKIIIPLLRTD